MHGCLQTQERREPSTTAWVLNGAFGDLKRGGSRMFHKGAFLEGEICPRALIGAEENYKVQGGEAVLLTTRIYCSVSGNLKNEN